MTVFKDSPTSAQVRCRCRNPRCGLTTITTPTTSPQMRRVRPIRTITACNITKAERSPSTRALFGEMWVKGLLDIENRTGAMAALIFGVSQGSVSRALAESTNGPVTEAELLVHHFYRASDAECVEFAREVGVDRLFDTCIVPNIT